MFSLGRFLGKQPWELWGCYVGYLLALRGFSIALHDSFCHDSVCFDLGTKWLWPLLPILVSPTEVCPGALLIWAQLLQAGRTMATSSTKGEVFPPPQASSFKFSIPPKSAKSLVLVARKKKTNLWKGLTFYANTLPCWESLDTCLMQPFRAIKCLLIFLLLIIQRAL